MLPMLVPEVVGVGAGEDEGGGDAAVRGLLLVRAAPGCCVFSFRPFYPVPTLPSLRNIHVLLFIVSWNGQVLGSSEGKWQAMKTTHGRYMTGGKAY